MDGATAARRVIGSTLQVANTALARRSGSYPSSDMARDGYVVREQFVSGSEAAQMLHDVARFGDRSVTRSDVPGTKLRDRAVRQHRDLNVRQLLAAQLLSPAIEELHRSGRIAATMSALTGLELSVGGLTVQIDWPDTVTKRGLHVDSHWPPTYKAFVYLTPVSAPEYGPFSVVPGSHRHRVKKVKAIIGNYRHGRLRTDLDHEYATTDASCLLGVPGTAIFADQRLAHAGWPGHTTGTRFMLVAYLYESHVTPPGFLS